MRTFVRIKGEEYTLNKSHLLTVPNMCFTKQSVEALKVVLKDSATNNKANQILKMIKKDRSLR